MSDWIMLLVCIVGSVIGWLAARALGLRIGRIAYEYSYALLSVSILCFIFSFAFGFRAMVSLRLPMSMPEEIADIFSAFAIGLGFLAPIQIVKAYSKKQRLHDEASSPGPPDEQIH
jgi:uncharacterized membrane protein